MGSKKNKKGEGFLASKVFLLLVVLITFILVLSFFFGDSGFIEIRGKRHDIEALQQDLDKLKLERDQLVEEVKALENDPLALERTARERLWLMKKNEKVIVILDAKEKEKEKQAKQTQGKKENKVGKK